MSLEHMQAIRSYDIFCRVIDNYGDIGVCWRLARQLADEHGAAVRLWVDDLASLHMLCAGIDQESVRQQSAGVDVIRWDNEFSLVTPAQVVIEAFGCGLPERYVEAASAAASPVAWIVLEYLSAEKWVRSHHGLPSPHPRLALKRYFYFPGFEAGTGGLLREADLRRRRVAFDKTARRDFWASLGFRPPAAGSVVVSMFGYEHAPLARLLDAWAHEDVPMVVAIPQSRLLAPVSDFLGRSAVSPGTRFQRGSLELRILPFVEQARYDELLWTCDCNFVRGEDSFVRAQWAARPFIWHIYPQQEAAHMCKLEAFLESYCRGLSPAAGETVGRLWRTWNADVGEAVAPGPLWEVYWQIREELDAHAQVWADKLAAEDDLAAKLALFCQDRLK